MTETARLARRTSGQRRVAWFSGAALVVALLIPIDRLWSAARDDLLAVDFRQTFLPAAEALLDGRSPYPEYAYPPLVAFLSVPFAIASSSELVLTVVLIACLPISLWLLGVRDWRCYAAAFLWVSTFNAIQTANVTLPLLLGAAACWRCRDRPVVAAVAGGLSVAAKIVAWPLALWLAVTRRRPAAAGVVVVALGVTFGLWALLGFSGLLSYPESLDRLRGKEGDQGYTLQALASDGGLPDVIGLFFGGMLAFIALSGVVLYGRRGDDARSYACAVVAVVVASPIVWLHSFALLLGAIAVLRPRLSWVWLLPAVLWFVSPGTGNGAPWQTALTLGVVGVVVLGALRQPSSKSPGWSVPMKSPAAARR